jgi:oxygen-independent coproporphyrinogen-3 oxidase
MDDMPPFDADLIQRYDRPGPRYTSYPSAPQFSADFGEAALRNQARRSNAEPIPRPLSLYVHVPFCPGPCFYCGCNRIITREPARGERYLQHLLIEIERVAPLFDRDRDVIQLHLGGGTPNFLGNDQLTDIMDSLGRQFHFSRAADRDFSIELDPRHVMPGTVAALAAAGFNRASLGVQDFDPAVQRAVNRIQTVEQTLEVIADCRTQGFRSLNIDLIYGLPKQTRAGFGRTLDTVIAARPDRLAVYSYAHLPELFKAQRRIDAADLPDPKTKLSLLELAIEKLAAAGYRYIGLDHFALPDDDLSRARERGGLQRNFMGYTTHGECDLIGLGVSAISHIGDSFSQNPRDLPGWEAALDAGRLPVWRGIELSKDDWLRADVIQQLLCHGRIDVAGIESRHGIDFNDYFAGALTALQSLAEDGLVTVTAKQIAATSRGRLLMRIIAMCFDRYLQPSQPARYSRTI